MKPPANIVADEMFPDGASNQYMDMSMEEGGSGGMMLDLATNEKAVHLDFANDFGDLFDDDDLD